MGKLFDKMNNLISEDSEMDVFLKSKGFYCDTMNPRFMNGVGYGKLTLDRPCMRHDSTIADDYTLRIFINDIDIYYEVQTPYRSYEISGRYDAEEYYYVEAIDELLDKILEKVLARLG